MKKHLVLLLLPAIALLLQGCKDKYCPCYPQDDTEYFPVSFSGKTMRYIFDDDTVVFNVMPPEFSEKYEPSEIADAVFYADATLELFSIDSTSRLLYRKQRACKNLTMWQLCLNCWHKDIYLFFVGPSFQSHTAHALSGPPLFLSEWVSPAGTTYTDVCRMQDDIYPKDTAYFSPQYGLLYYRSKGHYCLLLP